MKAAATAEILVFYRYVFMKDPALVSACFMEDTKMKSNTTKHHDDNKDDHTATPQTDDFHGEAQNRTLQKNTI